MPKVRELGVTVVPEGFGPVGIGGGGCGVTNPCLLCTQNVTVCGGFSQWACARITLCTDCTTQAFSICGTTPGPGSQGCTDCTTQAFSICGTTPGPGGQQQCNDCTTQAFSICGTTPGPGGPQQCTDCTTQAFSICGTTPGPGGSQQCSDCTTQAFSICGTTPNRQPQAGLTQESIRQLRAQMQQQLAALDEVEKNLGPKTEEEIAARENELQQELERLRARREELKNKNE